MVSSIFGGNTNLSYDQIKRQREIADQLLQANMSTPQNVGEGLSAIGRALAAKAIDKRTTRADEANRAAYNTERDSIFGSLNSGMGGGSAPVQEPISYSPNSPQGVAGDTMAALGKTAYTPGDRDSFVAAMMPHAMRVSQATGLDPRLVIAQAAQETGWGKSAPNNNFFGIKSHGKEGGANLGTFEYVQGQPVNVNDSFRTYGGMGESADDYARFLRENPRYKEMLSAGDLDGQLAALGASGYATDPNYSASVGSIARSIQAPGLAPAQPAQPQGQPPVNPAILMQLAEIQGNPYASESDKAIANVLMGQVTQAMDPMRQMEMERARLELDALKNPQPPAVIGEREQLAARGGLQPGTPEYQAFMLTGELPNEAGGDVPADFRSLQLRAEAAGLQPGTEEYQSFMQQGAGGGAPAAFVSLDMQAQAAGFAPGTPEYQEFMATRGAGLIAQAKTEGTAAGDAVVNLGNAVAKADRAVALIDQISEDEALPSITGMVQGNIPAGTPIIGGGQAGVDLEAKILQLQGTAFLEAFEALKGGGAITEVEGTKAEQAMARLQRAQSTEAYKAALADLKEVINNGKIRAQEKAAAAGGATSTGGKKRMRFNPETGMVE